MSLVGGRGAVDVRHRSVTWEMYAWCIIFQVAVACVGFTEPQASRKWLALRGV